MPSPSSNRTGGFPASGSRVRHSSIPSEIAQSEISKVREKAFTLGATIAPLTTPVGVGLQSLADEPVDAPEHVSGISQPIVICPAMQVSIDFIYHCTKWFETIAWTGHLSQFGPFPLYRLGRGKQVPISKGTAMKITVIAEAIAKKVQRLPAIAGVL